MKSTLLGIDYGTEAQQTNASNGDERQATERQATERQATERQATERQATEQEQEICDYGIKAFEGDYVCNLCELALTMEKGAYHIQEIAVVLSDGMDATSEMGCEAASLANAFSSNMKKATMAALKYAALLKCAAMEISGAGKLEEIYHKLIKD